MTDNQTYSTGDREYKKFSGNKGSADINVTDVTQSTIVKSVSGETLTLSAGAAGTTGKLRTEFAPITDSIGGNTGYYKSATDNDTSVSITHAALAGDEVQFNRYTDDDSIYALLSNGEYTIDYVKGILYYKKGAADTAGTIDYKYTKYTSQQLDASGATLEVNITAATDSITAYGTYNATEPSLSDGDLAQLQLNDKGQLKVTGGASSVTAVFQ